MLLKCLPLAYLSTPSTQEISLKSFNDKSQSSNANQYHNPMWNEVCWDKGVCDTQHLCLFFQNTNKQKTKKQNLTVKPFLKSICMPR